MNYQREYIPVCLTHGITAKHLLSEILTQSLCDSVTTKAIVGGARLVKIELQLWNVTHQDSWEDVCLIQHHYFNMCATNCRK